MLKTNNFNIEDYPKAARDPEQLLFPLHENPSLLFGSHSHTLSLVVEQPPDGPPRPFFKLRWPIRAHSEYILPRRSEMRAEQAPRGLSPCAGQVALTAGPRDHGRTFPLPRGAAAVVPLVPQCLYSQRPFAESPGGNRIL